MNWTVYTEALYAYFQLIHCIYIFLFRYFTSLHRGVSQQNFAHISENTQFLKYVLVEIIISMFSGNYYVL